jgi:hypothetical protein
VSNLAQDLIKILCENYAATPPLVLGLLWHSLLNAQGDAQTLVLDMEWILAKFPTHVAGIVSKIGRALFLPTNFQANLASSMNSNHFAYPFCTSPPSLPFCQTSTPSFTSFINFNSLVFFFFFFFDF